LSSSRIWVYIERGICARRLTTVTRAGTELRIQLPSAVRRMRSSRRLVVHEGVIRCSVAVVASVAGPVLEGRWPPRLISWQESTRSMNTINDLGDQTAHLSPFHYLASEAQPYVLLASDVSPLLRSIANLYRSRLTMNDIRRAYRRLMLQRGAACWASVLLRNAEDLSHP
jgi:hypothetical protein